MRHFLLIVGPPTTQALLGLGFSADMAVQSSASMMELFHQMSLSQGESQQPRPLLADILSGSNVSTDAMLDLRARMPTSSMPTQYVYIFFVTFSFFKAYYPHTSMSNTWPAVHTFLVDTFFDCVILRSLYSLYKLDWHSFWMSLGVLDSSELILLFFRAYSSQLCWQYLIATDTFLDSIWEF